MYNVNNRQTEQTFINNMNKVVLLTVENQISGIQPLDVHVDISHSLSLSLSEIIQKTLFIKLV